MQKKLHRKLALNRETLRTLTPRETDEVQGGGTTATTIRSTPTDTCDSCIGTICTSRNTNC
jgi:hypothetical protein